MKSAARDATSRGPLDVEQVRRDFPLLERRVGDHPLVYLDSAATTQKPSVVIDAVRDYYRSYNSNVHRGVHRLSQEATSAYEGTREKARRFLGARDTTEIVFVRGTTEAVNLVAQSYGRPKLGSGDEILITGMEHHSNIVPWQLLCEQTGAALRVIPILDDGSLDLDEATTSINENTKIVSFVHASNALGTINPARRLTKLAHAVGAVVMIDGAQASAHLPVDVQEIGCDFYAISGHKMFAPTGVGVLWGREELLDGMPPYQGGGDMIRSVTFEKTTFNDLPHKFEAGTPNIGGVIGLGAAIDYIEGLGVTRIGAHEHTVLEYGTEALSAIDEVRLIGTAPEKSAVLSFLLEGVHPHDIGTILDHEGVAIRTGHHCAQPVMDRFGVPATARASLSVFNRTEDIDILVDGLHKTLELFGGKS